MNSDELKAVMETVYDVFPFPEGLKGAHSFSLQEGNLELTIIVKRQDGTMGFQSITFDDGPEELNREVLAKVQHELCGRYGWEPR